MSVRLRVGDRLIDLCFVCCGRNTPEVKSQLTMIAKFLGVASKKPEIVCCGGVTLGMLQTLDKVPACKIGLFQSLTIHHLQFEHVLTKPSFSVMTRMEMFAPLRLLLPRVLDCLDLKWMQSTRTVSTAYGW